LDNHKMLLGSAGATPWNTTV